MSLLKCPKPETLLEYVTIPDEMSAPKRLLLKLRTGSCPDCQRKIQSIRAKWDSYFAPEPDINSSLLNVYSRLQNDETLILKGWKLDDPRRAKRTVGHRLIKEGWLFRGVVTGAMALLVVMVTLPSSDDPGTDLREVPMASRSSVPPVQIRIEDKDRVKVHYLQPELLQTIEFETASGQ